ncbi:MAG: flagellar hook-basal body complex protein [Planctomycetes bacterium]|nr:flagellar hook-basal body complex protein [Planctomycetota bacterium]
MSRSLGIALSGMKANQQWIDLIGNNLANSNTPGFKSMRGTFSTSFAQTLRYASAPNGTLGGRNAVQIGLGAAGMETDRTFSQGALTGTGRIFDLALEGDGFFALQGNNRRMFTRVGTFGLDLNHMLVDQGSGYPVLDVTGNTITVDTDALFPPSATQNLELQGNLPAVVSGPLAEVLTSQAPFEGGTPAILTGTASGPVFATGSPAGTAYTMEVVVDGGVTQQVSVLTDGAGNIAMADILAAFQAVEGVVAADAGGSLSLTSVRNGGEASLSVLPGGTNDLAGLLGLSGGVVTGVDQPVTAGTDLNDLTSKLSDYAVGDQIQVSGVDGDGSAVSALFTYGTDGTTLGDLVSFLDGAFTGSTVSLNNGQLVVTSDTPGEADLLLTLEDVAGNQGTSDWTSLALSVSTEGTDADEVVVSSEVYDATGVAHTLTLTFQRQPDLTWSVSAEVPASEGQVLVGGPGSPLTGIEFDADGKPIGLAAVAKDIQVQWNGQSGPQTMSLGLGTDGAFDGLTQFGSGASVLVDSQDGYSDGELANVFVEKNGTVVGFYTNGQSQDLAQLGVARFANAEGLEDLGNNMFGESANSGAHQLAAAQVGGRGSIHAGTLEGSNVDTAEQFVRLIEAQRGFQANARVISTQDELLGEAVNLI